MRPRILLVNPPIYDFAAYDFWLKPYGMLRAAAEGLNANTAGAREEVEHGIVAD